MDRQPNEITSRIKIRTGETFTIPQSGPHSPRDFNAREKGRVKTIVEFELPFAVENLQGELPLWAKLGIGTDTQVFLTSRQKSRGDIAASLGLKDLPLPKEIVIVGYGDRYGRVNVSTIRFQITGFIGLKECHQLFGVCLDWFNSFLEIYRRAKQDYKLSRISKDDIFSYRMAHFFEDGIFNEITQPVANLSLKALQTFPDDFVLRNAIWFQSQFRGGLWARLISEARHCLTVQDYRIAIINSITSLETVLKEAKGKNLKGFFKRHKVLFSRWKDKNTRESITVCLNLINLLCDTLGLDKEFTERVLQHYRRRNEIVHHGTMRVSSGEAQTCVDDINFLIRHILDLIHFSVTIRLVLTSLPSSGVEFEVIRMCSPEMSFILNCTGTVATASLQKSNGTPFYLKVDLTSLEWAIGERGTLSITYDAYTRVASLLYNTTEVDRISECELRYPDASLLRPEIRDERHTKFLPIQFILALDRVIQPNELADVDSIFQTTN